MAKKKVKVNETKVKLPEEVIVPDMVSEEKPVDVEVEKEQDSLTEEETVVEANRQEKVSVEAVVCNSIEPKDVEINMAEESSGKVGIKAEAEDNKQEINESLADNIENKEINPAANPMMFRSASEEARYYILEMLKDGKSHKKSEIVAYITNRSGKTFTEATVINVLRGMINTGSLISLERGTYSMGSGIGLVSKLISFIEVTRKNLDRLSTVSISDITEGDLSAIEEVKLLKETMETIYERLVTN